MPYYDKNRMNLKTKFHHQKREDIMNTTVEAAMKKLEEAMPQNRSDQQRILAWITLNMARELTELETVDQDTVNLITAVKADLIPYNMFCVDKTADKAYVLLGSEDYEHDYDASYIAKIQHRAKEFASTTKLLVKRMGFCGMEGLSHERGPHHFAWLGKMLITIEDHLPPADKNLLEQARSMVEAYNTNKVEEERIGSITKLGSKINKEAGLELSEATLEKLVSILASSSYGRQEFNFRTINELLVISQFKWNTQCLYGKYCTESSVTDYAVRDVIVVELATVRVIGSSHDEHLFRTTERGVVGSRYSIEIKNLEVSGDALVVEYTDGKVRITLK
jgi:hypothetical protein